MKPDDPKAQPRIIPKDGSPLHILAPASNATVNNTFDVDGEYVGAAPGTYVTVTLKYTDPNYLSVEQISPATLVSNDYWTVTFTAVSIVAGRKYRAVATANGQTASVSGLIVENSSVPTDGSGSVSEP